MKASSLDQPFRVARSRTGLGLFATAPIRKGAFIIEYWGKRIPSKTADNLSTKYLFEVNSRWTVDGSDRRNIARYINHSCKPNAEADVVRGIIKIRAIKTIKPGDEITYHYGSGYFQTFIKPKGCKCLGCIEKRTRSRRRTKPRRTASKRRQRTRSKRQSAAQRALRAG